MILPILLITCVLISHSNCKHVIILHVKNINPIAALKRPRIDNCSFGSFGFNSTQMHWQVSLIAKYFTRIRILYLQMINLLQLSKYQNIQEIELECMLIMYRQFILLFRIHSPVRLVNTSLWMGTGLRPDLEGFVVTRHECTCETGCPIPGPWRRVIGCNVRTSPSALLLHKPTDQSYSSL